MQYISQYFQWVIYVSQQTDNTDTTHLLGKLQASLTNRMGKPETSFPSEQHTAETCPDSEKILYEDVKKKKP